MKKILALLLAMMMVLALCACGDTAAEEPAAEEAVEAVAETATEPAGAAVEGATSGEASGEAADATASDEEASAEQTLELFAMDGYDKTFEGYIEWVTAALESQTGNPNLESDLASLAEVTEETYDASAQPFAMQIQFGLICSYEDFVG